MQFLKIQPKPGLYTDGTAYTAEGTWHDVDKVRFRKGFAEKIGGWVKFITGGILGSCRKLHNWAVNDGELYLAIGTHLKLYQVATTGIGSTPSTYTDITPIRASGTITSITPTNGKSVVVITHSSHGASAGDYVTISGAADTGGIAAASLNTEHKISALGDLSGLDTANKYTIQIDGAVATSSTPSLSGTAEYQISVGRDSITQSTTSATGWDVGTWGSGAWGGGATSSTDQLRVWSLDNYGDDLVANIRGAGIYYWDESEGGRATLLNEVTRRTVTITGGFSRSGTTVTVTDNGHGASIDDQIVVSGASDSSLTDGELSKAYIVTGTPTKNTLTYTTTASGTISNETAKIAYSAGEYSCPTASLACMTSERGRHLIAFGANPIGESTIDKTMVRWSSSENPAEWLPLSTNSAGFQDLSSGSKFQAVIKTRNEQLIWTDVGLVSMRYTGAPFYFSFTDVGRGMSIISPNAMANADGVVYFMDRGAFYRYSGGVQRLPCPVLSTIFEDFNYDEGFKVSCGTNLDYSEIIWFYPSASSTEVDRYVIYNYGEDVWYFGSLTRGAWDNAPLRTYPQAVTINKVSLGASPVSVTSSSSTVTITLPSGHGMPDGETVTIILSGLNSLVRRTVTLSSAVSRSGTTVTVTDVGHGASVGDQIVVSSAGNSELNGTYTVESVPTSDSLTYTTTTTGTIASTDATIAYENISDYMLNCQHSATISGDSLTFDIGTLADASGSGGGTEGSLIWENYTFDHENGWNGDGDPITAYIETGDFDLGDGDRFMSLGRIIPDLEFITQDGSVDIEIKGRDFPLKPLTSLYTSTFSSGDTQSNIRLRARQASMRVESSGSGFGWRLGFVRLDGRTDGKR